MDQQGNMKRTSNLKLCKITKNTFNNPNNADYNEEIKEYFKKEKI